MYVDEVVFVSLRPLEDEGTVWELLTGEIGEAGSLGPGRSFVRFFLNKPRFGIRAVLKW